MPMRRTSILLDPGLLAELERIARRQGRPTAHVIRDALERHVAENGAEPRELPGFVGIGHTPVQRPADDADVRPPEQAT